MNKWQRLALVAVAEIVFLAFIGLIVVSNLFADVMIHNPMNERLHSCERSPEQCAALWDTYRLTAHQEITLTTKDGFKLHASYYPSQNGAAIILLHGYKQTRFTMMPIAATLVQHNYGIIAPDLRGHGESDGELITFGYHELHDLRAAHQYLLSRPEVEPNRIGMLGNSMGASLAILYASENPGIKAVIAQSPYASLDDMVATNVKRLLGLPPFPAAPLVLFLAERKAGFRAQELAPIDHIAQLSPRPVFILMGGKDTWANPDGGKRLYATAGEPRELWFDPELGHVEFSEKRADEFAQQIATFYDRHMREKKQ